MKQTPFCTLCALIFAAMQHFGDWTNSYKTKIKKKNALIVALVFIPALRAESILCRPGACCAFSFSFTSWFNVYCSFLGQMFPQRGRIPHVFTLWTADGHSQNSCKQVDVARVIQIRALLSLLTWVSSIQNVIAVVDTWHSRTRCVQQTQRHLQRNFTAT